MDDGEACACAPGPPPPTADAVVRGHRGGRAPSRRGVRGRRRSLAAGACAAPPPSVIDVTFECQRLRRGGGAGCNGAARPRTDGGGGAPGADAAEGAIAAAAGGLTAADGSLRRGDPRPRLRRRRRRRSPRGGRSMSDGGRGGAVHAHETTGRRSRCRVVVRLRRRAALGRRLPPTTSLSRARRRDGLRRHAEQWRDGGPPPSRCAPSRRRRGTPARLCDGRPRADQAFARGDEEVRHGSWQKSSLPPLGQLNVTLGAAPFTTTEPEGSARLRQAAPGCARRGDGRRGGRRARCSRRTWRCRRAPHARRRFQSKAAAKAPKRERGRDAQLSLKRAATTEQPPASSDAAADERKAPLQRICGGADRAAPTRRRSRRSLRDRSASRSSLRAPGWRLPLWWYARARSAPPLAAAPPLRDAATLTTGSGAPRYAPAVASIRRGGCTASVAAAATFAAATAAAAAPSWRRLALASALHVAAAAAVHEATGATAAGARRRVLRFSLP